MIVVESLKYACCTIGAGNLNCHSSLVSTRRVRDDGAEHLQSDEERFRPPVELEVIAPEYHPEDSRVRHRSPCEHFF